MARGGAERVLAYLCAGLSKRGHACRIITLKEPRGGYPEIWSQVEGLTLSPLPFVSRRRLKEMIGAWDPTHLVFWQGRVLSRVHRHLGDATAGRPTIVAVRNSPSQYRGRKLRDVIREIALADAATFVSHGSRTAWGDLVPAARPKMATIYNGIDIGFVRSQVERAPKPKEKEPLLLYVGSLRRVKNLPMLVRAFALIRQALSCRLLILGDGRKRPLVEHLIRQHGLLDSVQLKGHQDNPFAYMAAADVLLLTSWSEGFSNVILEAHACGTPVVSTDCPHGPSEIIVEGETGRLVPVNDHEQMARAALEILQNPDRDRMRQACFKRAEAFSLEKMISAYERFFARGSVEPPG